MKIARISFLIGTLFFGIICGLGHLTFELLEEKQEDVVERLKELTVMFPDRESDMFLLTTGFSLLMGFMLLGYGVINLILTFKNKQLQLPSKTIVLANFLFSFIAFTIAYQYFFIFPIVCTGIAMLCFLISLILYNRSSY